MLAAARRPGGGHRPTAARFAGCRRSHVASHSQGSALRCHPHLVLQRHRNPVLAQLHRPHLRATLNTSNHRVSVPGCSCCARGQQHQAAARHRQRRRRAASSAGVPAGSWAPSGLLPPSRAPGRTLLRKDSSPMARPWWSSYIMTCSGRKAAAPVALVTPRQHPRGAVPAEPPPTAPRASRSTAK